jgi:uncharacterized zinc-type alcohol dehydrogenase-like protein
MGKFDLILDTVPYEHDFNPYIASLKTNGTIVVLGYLGPVESPLVTVPMIMSRTSIAGSLIGGIAENSGITQLLRRSQYNV